MSADLSEIRWESNFGSEAPFAIGVEEELLLVDTEMELVGHASRVLRRADPEEGDLSDELFSSMIEAKSEVSQRRRRRLGPCGRRGGRCLLQEIC